LQVIGYKGSFALAARAWAQTEARVVMGGYRGEYNKKGHAAVALSEPNAIRGATSSRLASGPASASLRRGWTKTERKSNVRQVL